jgi:basic amino acid/polyamine antiporter, APA family
VLANLAYLAALPLNGSKDSRPIPNVAETDPTFLRGIDHAKDDRVGTAVLARVSPGFGVKLMAIVVMISTFGCVNGLVLMGPRLYYAMAKDGLFFQSVGKLNKNGVPGAGLLLQAGWAIVLLFTGSYSELLDYIIFAALLFYVATVSAVFVLRRKQPDLPRPYRVPGYPVLPALYVLLCAALALALLFAKPVFSWPSFLIVLSGIPVFFFWRATVSRGR